MLDGSSYIHYRYVCDFYINVYVSSRAMEILGKVSISIV